MIGGGEVIFTKEYSSFNITHTLHRSKLLMVPDGGKLFFNENKLTIFSDWMQLREKLTTWIFPQLDFQ